FIKSDPVDVKLGELLKELGFVKEVLAIPPNFERLSAGSYQFGAKKIRVELQGGTNRLMVRVGGGWMSFLDFVKKVLSLALSLSLSSHTHTHTHTHTLSLSRPPETNTNFLFFHSSARRNGMQKDPSHQQPFQAPLNPKSTKQK
ncbi:hypothetical protein QOT17_025554, partial [Balamuthia mandrillaris]